MSYFNDVKKVVVAYLRPGDDAWLTATRNGKFLMSLGSTLPISAFSRDLDVKARLEELANEAFDRGDKCAHAKIGDVYYRVALES